jgi:EAL domain-containing protein (putative c-di-GMP-specific phosphodiesterase class I)
MAPGFADEFSALVASTGFPLDRLVVEVTEAVFIENLDLMRVRLAELTRTGIRVALDDFGTGYSNLRSLVGLPFSKIKLDRSLISEMETSDRVAMLVSTLVQWARASNLEIVAEGVETEMQSLLLKSLGCSSLQGFLFGRAMSARNLEKRLELPPAASGWAAAG